MSDPIEAVTEDGQRRITLVPASSIAPKAVRWLWTKRMPLGELTLLAGRENIGKSTIAYTLVAWITTGKMPGRFFGEPRAVVVAATEDSWHQTIVPRLMAAGANLDIVYRVDVTAPGGDAVLTLPKDLRTLESVVEQAQAVLVLLDPLMSRLDAKLDSHKDAEVRRGLEPLVASAQRAGASVLGIIHVNKSTSTDPLTLIMGSRAFPSVSRAVLVAMRDPFDSDRYLLGLEKSNLGPGDQPTFAYRIVGDTVGQDDGDDIETGKVVWLGDAEQSVSEALAAVGQGGAVMTATSEAVAWLRDYMELADGTVASSVVKDAAQQEGHSATALRRARQQLGITVESSGMPRRTFWALPAQEQADGSDDGGETDNQQGDSDS